MSFKIRVTPSGHEFTVNEEETLLDAALRQGLNLSYNCRGGTCGSCKGKIVEGRVEYNGPRPPALSDVEEMAGMALFCQARPASDLCIEVRELLTGDGIKPRRLPTRVTKKEILAHDVVRLYLKLPATERLQFLAGQYVDFLLSDGRRRSFSLANPPHHDDLLELHIRHVPGGEFTDYVFDHMREKEIVRIEGPFGQFYLREDSPRPMIFMAGGTGFAPIKAIIEHAFAANVTRPMHLYRGVRARRDLYLDALPREWAARHANFQYTPVLSQPESGDEWQGRTGYVHEAVCADYPALNDYDIYASGPPVMVKAAQQAFVTRGLPAEHFYSDPFEFAPDTLAKQAQARSGEAD